MATKTKKQKAKPEETVVLNEESIDGENVDTIETDAAGNGYLPGTEPVVIKPLILIVKKIETELKPMFAAARDALVAGKTELAELAHNNLQHFTKQPNGELVYAAAGAVIRIKMEKEVISTELEKSEDLEG